MIQIRDLCFRYGDSFQLRLNQLDIAAGRKVAIVGRSGSGKTTLLNLIAGIATPEAGSIHVCGHRMDLQNNAQRRKIRADAMGFVFQQFELIDYLTVRDNILLPFTLRAIRHRPADVPHRLESLLNTTGLKERQQHYPAQLSQGQRQRVALCRALVTQPKILLADEPTGSLDHQTAEEIIGLIFEQVERLSTTLVMVTHDQSWLARFDHVIQLDQPKVEGVGKQSC